MRAIVWLGLLLVGCLASGAASAVETRSTLEKIAETGYVAIGYRSASVPASYVVDKNGPPMGFAIDLCLRVVERLRMEFHRPDVKVKYVLVDSKTRIPAVVNGQVDLECSTTTNTLDRRKQVAFAVPHYFAWGKFLVKADSQIAGVSDLQGKRIVTNTGSTHLARLRPDPRSGVTHIPGLIGPIVVEAPDSDVAFQMLITGKADAFLFDDVVLYSLKAASGNPSAFRVLEDKVSAEPQAIMMRKGDPRFKAFVDKVLSQAMIDGDAKKMYDKWFRRPIPPKNIALDMPMDAILYEAFQFPEDSVGDEMKSDL
jgi:ABC-type amino acid transport substrate-binding protein